MIGFDDIRPILSSRTSCSPPVDADLQDITEAEDYATQTTTLERAKAKWATVAEAAGRRDRLEKLLEAESVVTGAIGVLIRLVREEPLS